MNDLHVQRYAEGVLLTQRDATIYVRADDLYGLAARLTHLREEICHDTLSPNGEDKEPDAQHADAARPLGFASAVFLAWDIFHAGYQVETLSCREHGRLVGWSILFRGKPYDSRVYQVRSVAEWEQWVHGHHGAGSGAPG